MNTIADRLRALADEVAALEAAPPAPSPDPAPAPAPLPVPEPAPIPPAPSPVPEPAPPPAPGLPGDIVRQPITDSQRIVWPTAWCWSPNYARYTGLLKWAPGAAVSVEYQRGRLKDGPGALDLAERAYTLHIDGEPVSTVTAAEGSKRWAFKFNAPATPGWKTLTVTGGPEGETAITYFAVVSGEAESALIPVVQSSFELSQRWGEDFAHAWAWVQVSAEIGRPTADHVYAPVEHESQQTVDMLVAGDGAPPTIPARWKDGSWSSMGVQAYFWDDAIRAIPRVHLRDGPRGVGTVCFATHIEIGRATQTEDPASAPRRNSYITDPWRLMRHSNTGEVTTLAGYRHRTGCSDEPPELVGDWSAIPPERHGFRLLWGMCWNSATLKVDPTLPWVDGRPPHPANPRAYVADSMNNRICRVEFDGRSHETPAKVSEIAAGLPGPWDCVEHDGSMIVSLREAHKIVRMSFDGEILDVIAERDPTLPGDAPVDARHIAWRSGCTVDEARAQPVLAPEGLYVLDGLLYAGSFAQQQITVFDLATKQIVRRVPITMARQSQFVKLAVSDGSYAPRGTIFFCTFGISEGARMYGIKPDGARWQSSSGSPYPMVDYQMSVGVGGGRMICGGSDYGLVRHYAGPRIDGKLYSEGKAEFVKRHGRIVYGPHGVGRFDVPADASEALRYFVACNYGGLA